MSTEYNSYVQYEGDGQKTDYTVTFPYLDKDHVEAKINGVPVFVTWISESTVRFPNEPPASGATVELRRKTPLDSRLVNYRDGAKFRAQDLNNDSRQLLYIIQEVRDGLYGALVGNDMDGIVGEDADPTSIVEEVTKKIQESALYDELQTQIEDISSLNDSVQDTQVQVADVDQLANELGHDQEDLSEASIRGYLREDDSLSRIRLLTKRTDDAEAAITEEQTVRATEDEALASDIQSVQASVDDNAAAIQEEQTARANEDEALASDISSLQTSVGNNESAIESEATTRANEDEALASDISTLQSSVDSNEAAIQEEQTTRANEDEALASDITTLQSSVDGNTASIETQASVIDGLEAQYTVKLDTGNRVVGFGLASDGTDDTSNGDAFVVNSNNFQVMDPDTGDLQLGWDSSINTFTVNGNIVADGTIKANKLDIPQVSTITSDLGEVTAGTFKTTTEATGQRVEISDSGSYPLWYGSGEKTEANAQMYLDTDGNAMYRGNLDVKSSNSQGSVEIKDNVIKVFDENGALRVQIGDLSE